MNLTRHNYEEYFLLYVDGELAAEERLAVEVFLEEHPDLVDEMENLRMTVLPQDEAFTFDKSLLYRLPSGGTPARIVPLTKWRLSVAAAVAIAVLTSGTLWIIRERSHDRPAGGPTAGVSTGRPATRPVTTAVQPIAVLPGKVTDTHADHTGARVPSRTRTAPATTSPAIASTTPTGGSAITQSTTSGTVAPDKGTPTIDPDPIALPTLHPTTPSDVAIAHPGITEHHPGIDPRSAQNITALAVTSTSSASYHTLEEGDQEADGDKILFVRTDQVVNGEVKGFFRRAGRLLKRSTAFNSDNVRPESDK